MASQPMTIDQFPVRKKEGPPLTMVTAYDAPTARLLSRAGIDIALVGDSVAMVVQGLENTLPVTIDEMIYHTRMVRNGLDGPLLVADMPFLSYQISEEEGHRNAGRLIKEAGAQAVKIEGGAEIAGLVRRLGLSMIPVIGHIGMKPMGVHQMGGFRVQGRNASSRRQILNDAEALLEAGVCALLLEAIPASLGEEITRLSPVPTIGIGAGPHTNGQVLVFHDLVGWTPAPLPRFVRGFGKAGSVMEDALSQFRTAVQNRSFPAPEETYGEEQKASPRKTAKPKGKDE